MPLHLSYEGSDLGPLERDRCPFGVVLIIGVAVARGRNHGVEVVRQARQASECLFTLGLKSTTRSIHALNADANEGCVDIRLAAFRSPARRSSGGATAAALKSGADVLVNVRLDTKVRPTVFAIPEGAWTAIEYTDAATTDAPAASLARCHIRGSAGVSMT